MKTTETIRKEMVENELNTLFRKCLQYPKCEYIQGEFSGIAILAARFGLITGKEMLFLRDALDAAV